YQVGLESLEARIVVHQKNEVVYEEDIALLKLDVQLRDISLKALKNQLESALKENDDLKLKFEKFETSSNNLAKLIGSQLDANNKTGLGYCNHINRCEANDSKSVNDEEDSSVNDRFKKSNRNHAVPPPYTRNYMAPRADLSFAGLDDSVYKCKESDNDNDSTISPISNQPKYTPIKINFVKPVECVECGENEKQVEKPTSFTQNPKCTTKDYLRFGDYKIDTESQEARKGVKSKNSTHKNSKGCLKMEDQEELIPPLKRLVWVKRMHPIRGGKKIQMKNLMLLMRNNNNKLMLNIFKQMKYWHRAEVQKKSNLNSQNMAFISSSKHSSGDEDGNTACVPTTSTTVPTASASVVIISQDTASAYIASQSSGSQIKFEDINQIDEDDMEEIDIKWSMALLSMRADKF
nr:hypothetical protein [Tanacetum cinerariifolium]